MIVALLGGSSRYDPVQIAALRPLCALMMIPALYWLNGADLRRGLGPSLLLGLFASWVAIQLVPLPPSIWENLPDRRTIAEIDQLAGLTDVWRPLSMAPFRGLNALASLIVPVTALALALGFKATSRQLFLLIVGIGLIDASLGLLQVMGGSRSPLYLFPIASSGAAPGIFANENHSAVFSAIVLLVIARLGLTSRAIKEPAWLRLGYVAAFMVISLALLVSGSRAGLLAGLIAVCCAAFLIWQASAPQTIKSGPARGEGLVSHRFALPALVGSIALLVVAFVWAERTPAFRDLFEANAFEDLRWALWPTLQGMMKAHWILGSGIGSFDAVYHIYEPTGLLLPLYVNQAHNDWAQVVIEGGLPAIGILAGLSLWMAMALKDLRKNKRSHALPELVFWIAVLALIGAASIVDYPLRTPVFQAVFVWLLLALGHDRTPQSRS